MEQLLLLALLLLILYLFGQFVGLMLNIMIKNGRDFMDTILL
jgi:hypothetical protein